MIRRLQRLLRGLGHLPTSLLSKAEFKARVICVRERMEHKEKETLGQWMTQEKMQNSGEYNENLELHC